MIAVRAPASSANLASGFDTFAVALGEPSDVVTVERATTTSVEVSGVGADGIPTEPTRNTAGAAAAALDVAAAIRVEKGVPPGAGLGSSGASAAAAAVALDRLYDLGLSRRALVDAAARAEAAVAGEAHADNVAAAIYGGFTVVTPDRVHAVDADVPVVLCVPDAVIPTAEARTVLPSRVPMADHVAAVGHAATVAIGMCRSDPRLVGAGLVDPVVTPARSHLLVAHEQAAAAARDAGAYGVAVSGAGPTLLAVCDATDRPAVAEAMADAVEATGTAARTILTRVGSGATFEDETR